ncbi:MAG: hypothetical protein LBH43_16250 [Treponema sp.]|jgi:hypothetical protein|nr:hypothetical protein [Treponema sp.]
MELTNSLGIISVVISTATLFAMIFGVRLGKKALTKSEILFGKEASEQYMKLIDSIPKEHIFGPYEYGGGNQQPRPKGTGYGVLIRYCIRGLILF